MPLDLSPEQWDKYRKQTSERTTKLTDLYNNLTDEQLMMMAICEIFEYVIEKSGSDTDEKALWKTLKRRIGAFTKE